jgi:hypothetical protein
MSVPTLIGSLNGLNEHDLLTRGRPPYIALMPKINVADDDLATAAGARGNTLVGDDALWPMDQEAGPTRSQCSPIRRKVVF